MPLTVALLGASGLLGSNVLRGLANHHALGDLKLVILHRESSDTSKFPAGVERRVLDSDNATQAEVTSALQGVDVLISTGKNTPEGGLAFYKHLAGLPTPLKAFIPSWWTANWTADELADSTSRYRYAKAQLTQKARDLGLPVTTISAALFTPFFFDWGFTGIDAKANRLNLYGDSPLTSTFSYISLPYLGEAVAQIIISPDFAAGKNYTAVETEFTGQELVDALAAEHRKQPEIIPFTEKDLAKANADANGSVGLGAGWKAHYGGGRWATPNRFEAKGVEKRSLRDAVRIAKTGGEF